MERVVVVMILVVHLFLGWPGFRANYGPTKALHLESALVFHECALASN